MLTVKMRLAISAAFVFPAIMPSPASAQMTTDKQQPPSDPAAPVQADQSTATPTGEETAAPATNDQEIVITADRTGLRSLQDTPIAVSVVGGDLIDAQGLDTIKDLAPYVPNLAVSRNVAGSIISIRGIGSNGGSDPSVATQVDGVYIANSTAFTDFFDVQRVEVLRGPQGTLYGRNTTGGLINIISRKPSSQFGGKAQLSYGNFNSFDASGYVTGPIAGEALTASLAATYRRRDPFFNNIAPGGHDLDSANNGGARFQARWQVTPDIDATTRIDYFEASQFIESYDHLLAPVPFSAPLANSLVGSYRSVAVNGDQTLDLKTGGISEEINWRLSDAITLSSITAWRKYKATAFNDNDATEVNALYFRSEGDTKQFTQEIDLRYKGERLSGVAGVYFFKATDNPVSHVDQPPSVATPANRSAIRQAAPEIKITSIAAFAQLNYKILPTVSLIAGARYTSEKTDLDQNFTATSLNPPILGANLPGFPIVFSAKEKDNAFTPKFGVEWNITDDAMFYASATRGFKSGGFNGQATNPLTAGYAPEFIWSYEAGLKTEWFDRHLRANFTGFYYDYKDLQVRQLLGPGNSIIANAASATVKGLEMELSARPMDGLTLTAIGSYLDARYDKFPTAAVSNGFAAFTPNKTCVGPTCTTNAAGNYLNDASKWSGLLGADYTAGIGRYEAQFHIDYSYRSRRYFDPSNIRIASQRGYGLVNANMSFGPAGKGWQVGLYGRNLTNAKYYQTISGNGFVPGGIVGDPRTYGARVGFDW